jgi:hypothetical protein
MDKGAFWTEIRYQAGGSESDNYLWIARELNRLAIRTPHGSQWWPQTVKDQLKRSDSVSLSETEQLST